MYALLLGFVALFSVTTARSLRGLGEVGGGNATVSLSWVPSKFPVSTWVAATCDRNTGRNIIATDLSFNIYSSHDFGLNVTKQANAANLGYYGLTSDGTGKFVLAGTQTSGVYVSTNFGTTWTLTSAPTSGDFYALGSGLKSNNGTGWIVVAVGLSSNVYLSKNSGSTWTSVSPVTHTTGASYGSGVGVSITGQVIQVTYTDPTKGTTVYISTNFGATWTAGNNPTTNFGPISASKESGQFLVAGGIGAIYLSSNYGMTWVSSTVPVAGLTYSYSAMSDSGQYAAIVGGTQIFFSNNYGISWTATNAPSATYTSISTDLSGDHWVASATAGKIYVGKIIRK